MSHRHLQIPDNIEIRGARVHNLKNVDMGPGGGKMGGRIVACGTPEEIRNNANSITGRYL